MITLKRKLREFPALLLLVAMLTFLLVGAGLPHQPMTAEECYQKNEASVLYLRSYYSSGSLKATGSGFIVSEDGLAVTAAHVIKGGAKLTAVQKDGSELALSLVQSNDETDIAVLRLPKGKYKAIELADKVPNTGAVVRAMGYPMKGAGIITEGIVASQSAEVSGKNRMLVTCDIVNGMSGGPILDATGRAVGVVSGSVRTMDGIHLSALSEALYQAAGTLGQKTAGK